MDTHQVSPIIIIIIIIFFRDTQQVSQENLNIFLGIPTKQVSQEK
jgi:hypothetical protein